MKKFMIVVMTSICILFLYKSHAQNAYYDAVNLAKGFEDKKFSFDAIVILAGYFDCNYSDYSRDQIKLMKILNDSLSKSHNPYLNAFRIEKGEASALAPELQKGILSSVGGLNVTNIADGLAQFMVQRAKEELNIAFFQKFKQYLDDPRFSDLKILFPQTYQSLSCIDSRIYQLNNYIQNLREAMQHDLSQIYEHAYNVLNQEKFDLFFRNYPELDLVLRGGLQIANSLQHQEHPGEIIHSLAQENFRNANLPNMNNLVSFIKMLDIFSQSFRSTEINKAYWESQDISSYWISSDLIYKNLLNDQSTLQIYLGLIYQIALHQKIMFVVNSKNVNLTKFLDSFYDLKNDFYPIKKYIQNLIDKTELVQNIMIEINHDSMNRKKADFDNYYRFINASLDLIEAGFDINGLPDSELTKTLENIPSTKYISIARLSSNIALNVKSKEYSTAITNIASLFDVVFSQNNNGEGLQKILLRVKELIQKDNTITKSNNYDQLISGINDYVDSPSNKKLNSISDMYKSSSMKGKSSLEAKIDSLKAWIVTANVQRTITLLIKYGTFAANMARAKSPEEVRSALEAAALPVGSYRMKRQSKCNISVNGYLGATTGIQYEKSGNTWVLGAWGPVGPEISFGNFYNNQKKASSSVSVFIPIIDIGALALFRLSNDSTKVQSTITLNQILSPGIILSWGIPGWPVSISAGYQLSSLLQSVKNGQPVISKNNPGRIILSLAVDIPLFNIHNTPDREFNKIKIKNNGKLVN